MVASALKQTLLLSTRPTLPSLRPGSQLCRFMSTWGDSDEQSRPTNNHSVDTPLRKAPNRRFANKNFHRSQNSNNNKSDIFVTRNNEDESTTDFDALDDSVDPFHRRSRLTGISNDPHLYRIFFRSPDKIRSLEEAQVIISHIKSSYGPLTQYQFSRCPETHKYFGYGFLTFKEEESLNKALADGYIRVGYKDFELKRTGHIPSRRTVIHKHTGFYGFYDLEELRASNSKQVEQESGVAIKTMEQEQESASGSSPSSSNGTTGEGAAEPFLSALPPSATSEAGSSSSSQSMKQPTTSNPHNVTTSKTRASTPAKPFFVKLEKTGMAQLWKTIPNEIARSERATKTDEHGAKETEEAKEDEDRIEIGDSTCSETFKTQHSQRISEEVSAVLKQE